MRVSCQICGANFEYDGTNGDCPHGGDSFSSGVEALERDFDEDDYVYDNEGEEDEEEVPPNALIIGAICFGLVLIVAAIVYYFFFRN